MTSKVEKNEGVTNNVIIAFIIGLVLLFLANVGFAQDRGVDAANTTAAASTVKEVPSVSKQLAGKWLKEAVKKADRKSGKKEQKLAEVSYGVLSKDAVNNRLYITAAPIDPESGSCGDEDFPCKITFMEGSVTIHGNATTGWYVDASDNFTSLDSGPYSSGSLK